MSKAEGIEKAVRHLRSAAYQHEFRMPKAGWEPTIDDALRRRAEEVYERCEIDDFGIPPELLDMYHYEHVDR